MSGLCYVYPELRMRLPRAWRCLAAWQRNQVFGEGGPESDELLAALQAVMRRAGRQEEADALALAHDCYLRESDFLQLRVQDVVLTDGSEAGGPEAAVLIPWAKTGAAQGVRVDWSGTRAMLVERTRGRAGSEPLFRTSQAEYLAAWHQACSALREMP
eukprot:7552670-Lingulodinium_polyedra.AAC.1